MPAGYPWSDEDIRKLLVCETRAQMTEAFPSQAVANLVNRRTLFRQSRPDLLPGASPVVPNKETSLPRILVLDIETAPSLGYLWGIWNQNIPLSMLERDWRIICFGAKWHGQKTVEVVTNETDWEDDAPLLKRLWALLDEADIVVGHNAQRFDVKKIRARMLEHGFDPFTPVRVVDTLAEVKKIAAFTSNKLEYLADKLLGAKKSKHKRFPGFEMWAECLKGNEAAWREMRAYQRLDVLAHEELWLRLRPWMTNPPGVGAYDEDGDMKCTRCGSHDVIRWGFQTTSVGRYARYKCKSCAGFSRSRTLDRSQDRTRILRPA